MTRASCRDRLEQALARIADPKGEGARACLTVYADAARAAADAADARARTAFARPARRRHRQHQGSVRRRRRADPRRLKILAEEAPPAAADATIVRRLRAAGAVIIAKTNMAEFAFSGLGANPHFGTPGNPRDRTRVPGGSSAGAPVAVADGMCEIAIGTDTGGSVRVPAALCGLVGFKPSRQRVPTDGAFPLSYYARFHRADRRPASRTAPRPMRSWPAKTCTPFEPVALDGLRFGIAQGLPLDRWTRPWPRRSLPRSNARPRRRARHAEMLPLFDDMTRSMPRAASVPPEACAIHRDRMAARRRHRPHCAVRIERGCAVSAADYVDMMHDRDAACARDGRAPCRARRAGHADDVYRRADDRRSRRPEGLRRAQSPLLRNTAIVNFFDLCAISLPLPARRCRSG